MMVDLADVDCQVTLKVRYLLETRSRMEAVDYAVTHLVAGYGSKPFLREVAKLLKPLPPSSRGNKRSGLPPSVEYDMVQSYRQEIGYGSTAPQARRTVLSRFGLDPIAKDRTFRRTIAKWGDALDIISQISVQD